MKGKHLYPLGIGLKLFLVYLLSALIIGIPVAVIAVALTFIGLGIMVFLLQILVIPFAFFVMGVFVLMWRKWVFRR